MSYLSSARRITRRVAISAAAISFPAAMVLAPSSPANAAPLSFTKIQGAAGNAAGLQGTVDAFRALVGDPNNGSTPGSQGIGRREINWDAVPDALAAPNLMPRDLFNTAVPRGAVFSNGAGNKFAVSANSVNPTHTPVLFGNVNPQYTQVFSTFSPEKVFTPVGTNKTKVRFFVPGTNQPAYVDSFGAVFSDVDLAQSTKIEVYDQWGNRLWWNYVPKGTKANKSLSFLGVKSNAKIYEVRITTGNAPLKATNNDGWGKDVVVMDDLLYGEPKPLH